MARMAAEILGKTVSLYRRNGIYGVCYQLHLYPWYGDIRRAGDNTNQCFYWIFVTVRDWRAVRIR